MNTFSSFFLFESKRFLCKRNAVIMLLLMFFLLYFVQTGINQYQETLKNNEEFKKIEKLMVAKYKTYSQYGATGIRMLFSPSPISVFFGNTGVISNLTAFLDSAARLRIFNSLKGKNGFVLKSFGFTDFSGIILYFGSLIALLFGFDSFHHKEYLRFLSSISNHRNVFVHIVLARIILLILTLMIIMGTSLILLTLNRLNLKPHDLSQFLNFCLVTLLLLLLFFFLGTIASTMKSKMVGLMTVTVIWFVLVFFIPAAIHAIIAGKAESITPVYQIEFQQFKELLDFEHRAITQQGVFNKEGKIPQEEIDLMESYWNKEYTNIHKHEAKMQSQMKTNISLYQGLSIFFPSTFYFSATNEISSKGYDNLMQFYQTSGDLKLRFTRYYINQIFYYSNYSKVKSFINGDENMYYASSRVPGNFLFGIIVLMLYIVILSGVSFIRYKKSVFGFELDWKGGLKNPRLMLDTGDLRPFYVEDSRFASQLYNLLSGEIMAFKENGFEDKIYIDDFDMVLEPRERDFFYICRLRSMPGDIKAGALLKLVTRILGIRRKEKGESGKILLSNAPQASKAPYSNKPISRLNRMEREDLLLSLLRHETRPIYLINDISKNLSIGFVLRLTKVMEELGRDNALVIYLTSDYHPPVKTLRKEETFFNHTTWKAVVDSLEGIAEEDDEEEGDED
jgi:ABC-type transport system involved in multi-copper enzyme maturation permease subunit